MAKSLGQIHNVNFRAGAFTAVNQTYKLDLAGELTNQLQRMVRAGTFHKVCGIDLRLAPGGITTNGGSINGRIRYFTPTRGRCEAFRSAFRSAAELMKSQGVSMRDNELYDFRPALNSTTSLNTFSNQATLDGSTGLALVHSTTGASVFGVHNEGVQPVSTTASGNVFTSGFDTVIQGSGGTDFVLNDTLPFTGNHLQASEEYEEIPFSLAYNPAASGQSATSAEFMWRPDPALYVAVMCGQMEVIVDDISLDPNVPNLSIEVSVQVAGWKSIMGNPDKRRRMKKKTSKK